MDNLDSKLKPIFYYALSYTMLRKFFNPIFILIEDDTFIKYKYKHINNKLYVKDIELVIKTHYDFSDADYDSYFSMLAELEQNNELIVSHIEFTPEEFTKEETKIINPSKIFKSEECIICLTNKPNILFCNYVPNVIN